MNKRLATSILTILWLAVAVPISAIAKSDDERPITQIYSLEIGKEFAKYEYLSPCRYEGTRWSVSGRWGKRLPFAPDRARMDFDAALSLYPQLVNPAGYVAMQGFDISCDWQMSAFWNVNDFFDISIGVGPGLNGGVFTLLRNSNNPVSVNLSADLLCSLAIGRNFRIGRLPVYAEWRLRSPLLGAFFMPGYGETFYEIYLGNRKGLVHCGWPGNHFAGNSHLSLRLNFGKTAMEVGYRFISNHFRANNLSSTSFSHSFTIGIIPHGLRK